MAMWAGSTPTVWCTRLKGGSIQGKYIFFSPRVELGKNSPAVVVSFPQIDGASLKPEVFMMKGYQMRISVSFKIIPADVDMSYGSPGSIQTVEEQCYYLVHPDNTDAFHAGRLKDMFRLYITPWFGSSSYLDCVLEEIRLSQNPGEEISATARFLFGPNALG